MTCSEISIFPRIFSWLSDQDGEYMLYLNDHRYGYGYCAAIVPTRLAAVISNATTGGDSYVPYNFANFIGICEPEGLPVAYDKDATAALFKLERQLSAYSEAYEKYTQAGWSHPAFELYERMDYMDQAADGEYEEFIDAWAPLTAPKFNYAAMLLSNLRGEGYDTKWWRAIDDKLITSRVLELYANGPFSRPTVFKLRVELDLSAAIGHSSLYDAADFSKLAGCMAVAVDHADDKLVALAVEAGFVAPALNLKEKCRYCAIEWS